MITTCSLMPIAPQWPLLVQKVVGVTAIAMASLPEQHSMVATWAWEVIVQKWSGGP